MTVEWGGGSGGRKRDRGEREREREGSEGIRERDRGNGRERGEIVDSHSPVNHVGHIRAKNTNRQITGTVLFTFHITSSALMFKRID